MAIRSLVIARKPAPQILESPMQRQKVLHLVDALEPGGVATVISQLIDRQLADDYAVSVLALRRGAWQERIENQGVAVHVGHLAMLWLLATRRGALIHSHHRRTGLFSFLIGAGGRTVEHIHNEFENMKLFAFRCKYLVAVSQSVQAHTEQTYQHTRGRVLTIRNGISITEEAVLNLRERELKVVACGRLAPQKDPYLFSEIAREARRREVALTWHWIGDGPLRNAWLEASQDMLADGFLRWRGELSREAISDELRDARFLIMTSRWEGQPMVALEALAAGTPVLSTQVGELNVVLTEVCGESELQRESVKECVDRIVNSLERQDDALPQQILAMARQKLSFEEAWSAWRELYKVMKPGLRHPAGGR